MLTLLNQTIAPFGARSALNPPPVGHVASYIQRGHNSGYVFYDPSASGIIREITMVGPTSGDTCFLLSSNLEIRVFVGFGTATNTLIPDLRYQVFALPIKVALGCWAQTNKPTYSTSNPSYYQTRNSRWVDSKVSQQDGNYYLRLKFPMQYTNGVEVIVWDPDRNIRGTNGWYSTVYEHGSSFGPFANYITRSAAFNSTIFGSTHNPVGTNNTVLASVGTAGVYLGTMLSSLGEDTDTWLESKFTFVCDNDPNLWQSSGGEDYFHNPFYFQWNMSYNLTAASLGVAGFSVDGERLIAPDIGYDYGTTYSYFNFTTSGQPVAREGYRWFSSHDAPTWTNSMQFKYLYDTNGSSTFDSVVVRAVSIFMSP